MNICNSLKISLFSFFFISVSLSSTYAQESMMDNFSYLYMEKLIAAAKENYPKVKSYATKVKIAKGNLSQQKSSWLDPFSFSYIYRSNTTIDVVNPDLLRGYQFGVTISPGTILKKPFVIKNAKEEVKVAELDKFEYELSLETEVKRRYVTYLQSLNLLKLNSKMLVDSENSFRFNKAKYEKNEISFKEYNDISLALSSAQTSRIEAEANLLIAKMSLEELLTKKIEEIK